MIDKRLKAKLAVSEFQRVRHGLGSRGSVILCWRMIS